MVVLIFTFCITVLYPIYRFISKVSHARKLYDIFYTLISKEDVIVEESNEPSENSNLQIQYVDKIIFNSGAYTITIGADSTENDILINLETILNDAFNYSEGLSYIPIIKYSIYEYKISLAAMRSNVKTLLEYYK